MLNFALIDSNIISLGNAIYYHNDKINILNYLLILNKCLFYIYLIIKYL